jgi:hypothetical protein
MRAADQSSFLVTPPRFVLTPRFPLLLSFLLFYFLAKRRLALASFQKPVHVVKSRLPGICRLKLAFHRNLCIFSHLNEFGFVPHFVRTSLSFRPPDRLLNCLISREAPPALLLNFLLFSFLAQRSTDTIFTNSVSTAEICQDSRPSSAGRPEYTDWRKDPAPPSARRHWKALGCR